MAKKKEFKAESKRLLDLMINSIYTHKEIFLRELVSNASDAIDKLYYEALTHNYSDINQEDLYISINPDKDNRTITIIDNGIGMSKEELEDNLGTIAKSGSLAFKEKLAQDDPNYSDIDVIGQFGVGFYSAFMIAKKVEVFTKQYGAEKSYKWVSNVSDGYTIEEDSYDTHGTKIVLYLKDNAEENYDEYLETYTLEKLIKKYSDYVRYPIKMDIESSKQIQGEEDEELKYETIIENKTLNSMIPLWKKSKNEISKEEYDSFYESKFNDYTKPQKVIHMNVEGNVSFTSLLFVPGNTPVNYYSNEYEKGLQLYCRGVFIQDKASDLLPEHFRFVKGLVDSQDLSLNISREMLQHDRQLKVIANKIEKKIKSELSLMLKNDREQYDIFWKNFGLQIKFGIYNDYGVNKELLQDLLMFHSSKENKLVTLDEYIGRMKEDQKYIYYVSGDSIDKIDKLPQSELVKDKDYEILYLTDNIDEFVMQVLFKYNDKEFKNITQGDLELESEEEKQELEKKNEDNKDLLNLIKEGLQDKVSDVRISSRLKTHPVCLVASEGMSFEMEKVLKAMPNGDQVSMKANRILEINPNHSIFDSLKDAKDDKELLDDYAYILYNQALLIEGFDIEDPIEYTNKVCKLMIK